MTSVRGCVGCCVRMSLMVFCGTGKGGDVGWNISMARVCRSYDRVIMERSRLVAW